MNLETIERIIAIAGGLVVGVSTIISLRLEWKTRGLDNQVFKLMLGLMALGCVIVILAASGVIGWGGKGG